jgi:hypothetical protein
MKRITSDSLHPSECSSHSEKSLIFRRIETHCTRYMETFDKIRFSQGLSNGKNPNLDEFISQVIDSDHSGSVSRQTQDHPGYVSSLLDDDPRDDGDSGYEAHYSARNETGVKYELLQCRKRKITSLQAKDYQKRYRLDQGYQPPESVSKQDHPGYLPDRKFDNYVIS